MGSVCSAKKKKEEPYSPQQIVATPQIEEKQLEVPSTQITQKEKQYQMNKEILVIHYQFTKLIDLVCIDNQLPEKTQISIRSLISIKKNTDIIIQNSSKRAQRHHHNISPEEIICKDLVFGNVLWTYLDKVARLLEDQILIDKDFEESYPILSTNLGELHDSIVELAEKYKCNFFFFQQYQQVRGENVSTNIPKQQQIQQSK